MNPARAQALTEHLPAMLRFARSLTRDPHAADDLVQDVVVRALERDDRFDPGRSYLSWLLAVTHNLFVDGWRRGRRRDAATPGLAATASPWMEAGQETAVILRETLQSFEALPPDQRAVLHLVVVEGLSYGEAAEVLGVPTGTVMSRLSRGRSALRNPPVGRVTPPLRLVSDRNG